MRKIYVFIIVYIVIIMVCSGVSIEDKRLFDSASPFKKTIIKKKKKEFYSKGADSNIDNWLHSEKKKIRRIEEWEANQILKASKKFKPLTGGYLMEKDFGAWGIKFGTWGEKDGWTILKIEW